MVGGLSSEMERVTEINKHTKRKRERKKRETERRRTERLKFSRLFSSVTEPRSARILQPTNNPTNQPTNYHTNGLGIGRVHR